MVFGEIKPMPEDPLVFVYKIVKEVITDIGYDFGKNGKRCMLYCQAKAILMDGVYYICTEIRSYICMYRVQIDDGTRRSVLRYHTSSREESDRHSRYWCWRPGFVLTNKQLWFVSMLRLVSSYTGTYVRLCD